MNALILRNEKKMRKKVLLTGASGTVGLAVLNQLYDLRDKFEITVFDVKTIKSKKLFKPFHKDVNIIYGNIINENDLVEACTNKDTVIHLAAIIPPLADDLPELARQVNVVGTQNLIRLLEQHSPNAFFLYSSSISVYGDRLNDPLIKVNDPLTPSAGDEYGKTKVLAEEIVQNSKLDWSIFRLSAVMGGHKISKLMFHQPLKTSLEIAAPEDTARAFINAIDKQDLLSKRIFNLGGGESCRVIYDDFLQQSFEVYGLGKLDFTPKSFAEKNFHCGFYEDGDTLEEILNFRKNTLVSHFEKEKKKVSPFIKTLARMFKRTIKRFLQKKSEPLQAYKDKDKERMDHYFAMEEDEEEKEIKKP